MSDTVEQEKKLRQQARMAVLQCGYPSVRAYILAKLQEVVDQANKKNRRSTGSKKERKLTERPLVESR